MGAEDENINKVELSDESISKHSRSGNDETLNDDSMNKARIVLPEDKVIIDCPPQPPSPRDETNVQDLVSEKKFEDSVNRVDLLVHVITQKKLALVKAWEESQKSKASNRSNKKILAIGSWKDSKNAAVDAQLKRIEEKYERKKAKYAEKMHNKKAEIHKEAEEKKAIVNAQRGQSFLKINDSAAKFRATGKIPKNFFRCFGFRSHN